MDLFSQQNQHGFIAALIVWKLVERAEHLGALLNITRLDNMLDAKMLNAMQFNN